MRPLPRTRGAPGLIGSVLLAVSLAGAVPGPEGPRAEALRKEALAGKSFRFRWVMGGEGGVNGIASLQADGAISGIASPNESSWTVDKRGRLLFRHEDGRISSTFLRAEVREGKLRLEGPFHLREGIVHVLEEVDRPAPPPTARPPADRRISPEDARRIQYSRQEFIYLDPGETHQFRLKTGEERRIRLASVREERDSVVGLVRRAGVALEVDGEAVSLLCAPYVMPTVVRGLRIQADTTSEWLSLPARLQLSVWDASDPIVDIGRFGFPLKSYRFFSHGTQAYGEPVHLGHRDGDPKGQRFYHDYGFDLAGYEGREEVASSTDGTVVRLAPAERPHSVAVEDSLGLIFEYDHLDRLAPGVREGAAVRRGDVIGILGRRGASGNFSHLHVGTYLTRDDLEAGRSNRNLNLYPWLVVAYEAARGMGLHAVARPHLIARTGERVLLDGSRSLAHGGEIVSYRWSFPDGTSAEGPVVERAFDRPGLRIATLRVRDRAGREDVDFAAIKVFSSAEPEEGIPTIFMTQTPTEGVGVGDEVRFRLWVQGAEGRPLRVDFGDGDVVENYEPYAELLHRFREPGIHAVTASAEIRGLPVTQAIKVIVEERDR